jgi:hypothetical protein
MPEQYDEFAHAEDALQLRNVWQAEPPAPPRREPSCQLMEGDLGI